MMVIVLRQGIGINNPVETISTYHAAAGKGARAYDATKLPEDNHFPEDQIRLAIRLARRLGARWIPTKTVEQLIAKQPEIEDRLSEVPTSINILDDYDNIPWDKLGLLFKVFRIPYMGPSRITKVLHKKRPNLIPILDTGIMVNKYLQPLLAEQGITQIQEETERMVCQIKELKKDVDLNREALKGLELNIKDEGYDISILRILDILIWHHFYYG